LERIFPAGSRTPLRLLIQIPEELQKQSWRLAVRQIFEDVEVGRVTWLLRPREVS
jgi:serine protease